MEPWTKSEVEAVYGAARGRSLPLPVFLQRVQAGFPNPADDFLIEGYLDLNEHLVRRPAATYYLRVAGTSMIGAGIHPGDLLVVDRAIEPGDGHVVVAVLDGELTVKRLRLDGERAWLEPDNPAFAPLRVFPHSQFEIWGVVSAVIHPLL
jgi:DNA polymerase V